MLTLIIGIVTLIIFWVSTRLLSNKKGYKLFLILSMFASVALACICLRFLPNTNDEEWIRDGTRLVYFAISMISMLELENAHKNGGKDKSSDGSNKPRNKKSNTTN